MTVALAGLPRTARAAEVDAPKPWLRSLVDKARKLADRRVAPGSNAEAKWKTDIKAVIDDILDWDELTKRSLGRHWKARSEAEKTEFSRLLREMIEASYQSKLRLAARDDSKKPKKVEIEWLEEKVNGRRASAAARLKADRTVAVLEFKLRWAANRWRVYDVAIDDVSTVRTYRSQFGKIIGKEGFGELLKRVRRKTEEIRKGLGEIAPP